MPWYYWALVGFGAIGFIAQSIGHAATISWKLGALQRETDANIRKTNEQLRLEIAADQDRELERLRHEMGEMGHALRARMQEVQDQSLRLTQEQYSGLRELMKAVQAESNRRFDALERLVQKRDNND